MFPRTSIVVQQVDPISKRENTFKVTNILRHPRYGSNGQFMSHDFALLRLKVPVTSTNFFVCLPNDDQDQFVGANLTISGWGITKFQSRNVSKVLKAAFVIGISNFDCLKIAEEQKNKARQKLNQGSSDISIEPHTTVLCVDGHLSKSSPCNGDSGGTISKLVFLNYFTAFLVSF